MDAPTQDTQLLSPIIAVNNISPFSRFSKVGDPDDFLNSAIRHEDEKQGHARLIFEARQIIDRVDPKICEFLREFNLRAEPEPINGLSDEVIEKLDGAPKELLVALLQYIDFTPSDGELDLDVEERNTQTLAKFIAERFTAICLVAHGKKMNKETTSFYPERHEKVLTNRSFQIANWMKELDTARKVFGDFMQAGCEVQDAYINSREVQNCPMERKLSRIGITPIFA